MKNNKHKSSRFYLVSLTATVLLLLFAMFVSSSLLIGKLQEGSDVTSFGDKNTSTFDDIDHKDEHKYEDISDVFAETSLSVSEDADPNESSDVSSESSANQNTETDMDAAGDADGEMPHGWVINQFGYTYIYGDTGYEQFNYKNNSMERYINCLNSIGDTFSSDAKHYNIIVPISTTFASIPREIYTTDNFYNQSQSSFVSTVESRLNENIINIPLVPTLESKYDNGEYVYFRTDKNWTSLGAYYAYVEFCNIAGITPYPIDHFKKIDAGEYLGGFYNATNNILMKENPDSVISYAQTVSTALTIYDNDRIYSDYMLCANLKIKGSMFEYYFGKEASRYEICTTENEKRLLVIGDSSVCPMIPFLISHYNKIDVINPEKFDSSLIDFFTEHEYDDIITMCYSTNAISGEYTPCLKSIIGENQNVE